MYRRELLVATDILHIYLLGKEKVNLTYTISHIESEWWGWKPVQLLQLPLAVLSGNKIESINYDWNTSHAPGLAHLSAFWRIRWTTTLKFSKFWLRAWVTHKIMILTRINKDVKLPTTKLMIRSWKKKRVFEPWWIHGTFRKVQR